MPDFQQFPPHAFQPLPGGRYLDMVGSKWTSLNISRSAGPCIVRSKLNTFLQVQVMVTWGYPRRQTERKTDMTKNITFPQLCWRAVKITNSKVCVVFIVLLWINNQGATLMISESSAHLLYIINVLVPGLLTRKSPFIILWHHPRGLFGLTPQLSVPRVGSDNSPVKFLRHLQFHLFSTHSTGRGGGRGSTGCKTDKLRCAVLSFHQKMR